MSDRIQVLSFGGGVQTVAMLRMVLAGDMPRPDAVVFSDTGDEQVATYEAIERERREAERVDLPFFKVDNGIKLSDAMKAGQGVFSPAFTKSARQPEGRLPFKSCTGRFKIEPMRRFFREQGWDRVSVWLGITTDEIKRVKPSDVQWAENKHPFIDQGVRRAECEGVLNELGLPLVKSACVHCPNRTHFGWETVKAVDADWERAVAVDQSLRHSSDEYETFVHRDRRPIEDVVQLPQPGLFDDIDQMDAQAECEGICHE